MNIEKVLEIFEDILDLEDGEIDIHSSPEDIDAWDSMANVNIIVAIEEEFKIKFRLEDIEQAKIVNDFVDLVDRYV